MFWRKWLLKKLGRSKSCAQHEFSDGKEGISMGESGSGNTNFQALKTYGRDVVGEVGRDEEVMRVIIILSRKTKNNPLLIADLGASKTAVVRGLVEMIERGHVPSNFKNVGVIALDIGRLAEGAKNTGEFEDRLKAVVKEVQEAAGKVILFIDNIHLLLGGGRTERSMVAAHLLKPMLATGQFRCIGGTTLEAHRKYLDNDVISDKNFEQLMVVDHFYLTETIDKMSIVKATATVNDLKFLERGRRRRPYYCIGEVATGKLPISDHEKETLLGLANRLRKRVAGQDQAIQDLAEAVVRCRDGLGRAKHPIASILIAGPNDVSKTELAKALAQDLFHNRNFVIRIYMSEYMKCLGVELANVISRNPYNVVLLDGVEKGHQTMLTSLFQLLDGGSLRDTDTVIILSSNFGAGLSGKSSMLMKEVRRHYKPEVIERLDEIVVFDDDEAENSCLDRTLSNAYACACGCCDCGDALLEHT